MNFYEILATMKILSLNLFIIFIGFTSFANDTKNNCAVKVSYYRKACLQTTAGAVDFNRCMRHGFHNIAFVEDASCKPYIVELGTLCRQVPVVAETEADCYIRKIDNDLKR